MLTTLTTLLVVVSARLFCRNVNCLLERNLIVNHGIVTFFYGQLDGMSTYIFPGFLNGGKTCFPSHVPKRVKTDFLF